MWFHGLSNCMTGEIRKIAGSVVLIKKNVPGEDVGNSQEVHELPCKDVSFQLVSSTQTDPITKKGKVGRAANLKELVTTMTMVEAGESMYKINFEWKDSEGIPGAVIVKNNHHTEFLLKTLTLENVLGKGKIHFVCNSWIYPECTYDRIFFTNEPYLPSKMPLPLLPYREQELINLRGDDVAGPLKENDRVYGYAVYNDLGDPDKDEDHVRLVLGGPEYPYPRRCRTSRPPTKRDPKSESRLVEVHTLDMCVPRDEPGEVQSLDIYVPCDERFGHLKLSVFLAFKKKIGLQSSIFPGFSAIFDSISKYNFKSFEDIFQLYELVGIPLLHPGILEKLHKCIPFEFFEEWFQCMGYLQYFYHFSVPHALKENPLAWLTDDEFGREMLAGVNPVIIRRLLEFPPTSNLDPVTYGNQRSLIKEEHILQNLQGLTVPEALMKNRLFILDHHDAFMPYLPKINALKGTYIYATRTLLFLRKDGTMMPLAIELSQPHPDGFQRSGVSEVYTPASEGVDGFIWQLAKTYVVVNDSGYHQLISHWLNTHAVIEPFIIATHRQLSVTHPIHKLMIPHYHETLNINALSRQILINAGGVFESTTFLQKHALTMSSDIYKSWKFTEQGLPDDLIKRGVAVEDHSCPHKLRLLIEDYPYAVDGLAVWSAIESWVNEYCSLYYANDLSVKSDTELQDWWKEIREVGHGDKKDEEWWPKMNTVKELTKSCTTIIWVASALHAAVNFGQYAYSGLLLNRPTVSSQPMPELGNEAYKELMRHPDRFFWKIFSKTFMASHSQNILRILLNELLSQHSSDEVYLGQRNTPEWTSDEKAMDAFDRFAERLVTIEKEMVTLNSDGDLKNRCGPVRFPYTLLYPNTLDRSKTGGLVPRGIPNSVSI